MLNTVASLLKQKEKSELVAVAPSASVADAVRAMNDENVGAVLVMDGQNLVGIFTERDVMVRIVGAKRDASTTLVSEVMTATVRTIEPTSTPDDALRLMSDRRHRHLPVVENGRVHGLISIGDVTRWYIRSQPTASRFRSSGREADGCEQSTRLTLWLPRVLGML